MTTPDHSHDGHGGHGGHDHEAHQHHSAYQDHGSHGGHAHGGKHAGHHTEAFRQRVWWCLAMTIPVVATSHMVMDWFGYELDFPGIEWVGPILGSVIFFWGGWPFLEGGRRELKDRQPGMMLLIGLAITVFGLPRFGARQRGATNPIDIRERYAPASPGHIAPKKSDS